MTSDMVRKRSSHNLCNVIFSMLEYATKFKHLAIFYTQVKFENGLR